MWVVPRLEGPWKAGMSQTNWDTLSQRSRHCLRKVAWEVGPVPANLLRGHRATPANALLIRDKCRGEAIMTHATVV